MSEEGGSSLRAYRDKLVSFNAWYYRYPNTADGGLWQSCLTKKELLQDEQAEGETETWLRYIQEKRESELHNFVTCQFVDAADVDTLLSVVLEHGVFARRFFEKEIRDRVRRRVNHNSIDLVKFQELVALAFDDNCKIFNRSEAISVIVDHIFEQTILLALACAQISQGLDDWFDEQQKPKSCIVCDETFRLIDVPYWVYFGSNGFKACCFQCPIVERPKKSELKQLVPAFVASCGFIPNSSAGPITYSFTSRLSPETWTKVILAYGRMGSIPHVVKKFGSWFEALAQTGALPNDVLVTKRGVRFVAHNGHVCHSLDEQLIDNWLSVHEVPHDREPLYPVHQSYNTSGRRRADWLVHDVFIEYFGLVGNAEYDEKVDEKISLAGDLGIDLIAIYPSDIDNLEHVLGVLI